MKKHNKSKKFFFFKIFRRICTPKNTWNIHKGRRDSPAIEKFNDEREALTYSSGSSIAST